MHGRGQYTNTEGETYESQWISGVECGKANYIKVKIDNTWEWAEKTLPRKALPRPNASGELLLY